MKQKMVKAATVLVALVLMYCLNMPADAAAKTGWVRSEGYVYYQKTPEKKAVGLVKIKGKTYYFNKRGERQYGWYRIKQKGKYHYYCFNRSNGSMLKTTTVKRKKYINGIYLQKSGRAAVTKANRKKLQMLVAAEKVRNRITNPTMSKAQKLKKCFDWVQQYSYITKRVFKPETDWVSTYARDILVSDGGNCYSNASSFAFLANACGYSKIYVCRDKEHGWTEIAGRVYDPLYAQRNKGGYYKWSYKKYYAAKKRTIVEKIKL